MRMQGPRPQKLQQSAGRPSERAVVMEDTLKATDAVIAVTYRCNSRCSMCDIWRAKAAENLLPTDYRALPSTLKNVNITGGEPFLRTDLGDIVFEIRKRCPKARLVISTNGFLTKRIAEVAKSFTELGIRISIDGPADVHDRIRGVNGAYERALETIVKLKELGHRDLGISLTASKLNAGKLLDVKRLADDLRVEFTCTVVHSSPIYFGDTAELSPGEGIATELVEIRDSHLASRRPKDWFRAYYVDGLEAYAEGKPKPIACKAARGAFFLDPAGNVYACNILDVKLGDIRDGGPYFGDEETLAFVGKCPMRCWMVCTVAPAIRRNPLPALIWVAERKLGIARLRLNRQAAVCKADPGATEGRADPRSQIEVKS